MSAPNKKPKSALKVNSGIEQPPQLNDKLMGKFKKTDTALKPASYYIQGILNGDITILSRAITLTESTLDSHKVVAADILAACLPYAGKSIRIGITGVPGVGKSTFIEALGTHISALGKRLAVLAVDPSSQRSKGSILGDKTRMEELATNPLCFIRPSPSAGSLGGVARKTRETIILCEAAGYEVIFIETVGVGQSETTVKGMVDFFLLLMLAGAGDELQGIKRGIMEMADMIVINKADGDNINKAKAARIEYANALHLFPPPPSGWTPETEICSAITKFGISEIWQTICNYETATKNNNYFFENRASQQVKCMHETIFEALFDKFSKNTKVANLLARYEKILADGKESPYTAAKNILDIYFADVTN